MGGPLLGFCEAAYPKSVLFYESCLHVKIDPKCQLCFTKPSRGKNEWLPTKGTCYPFSGVVTVTAAVMEGVGLLMEFNSTAFL